MKRAVCQNSRINYSSRKGNVLCMHPESGKGIELAMNETLLHSFSKLLTDAVSVSGWDIELGLPADTGGEAPVPDRVN